MPIITDNKLSQQISCYYDLHVPAGYEKDAPKAWPLLIALHGYEGNKESMLRLAQGINETDWLIASLQGPYQFMVPPKKEGDEYRVGFGWLTPYKSPESVALHHQNILRLIENTAQNYRVDRSKIFLLGFSQACAVNYRFVFTYPNIIRGAIGVCGGIPGDWQTAAYQNSATDVLHIAGAQDEFYPIDRALTFKEALAQRANSVELATYETGHIFPRQAFGKIREWVATTL